MILILPKSFLVLYIIIISFKFVSEFRKPSDFFITFFFYIWLLPFSIFFEFSNSEFWIYFSVLFQYILVCYFRNLNLKISQKIKYFKEVI